jgi:peptide/nickel transport system substrate-binding protein
MNFKQAAGTVRRASRPGALQNALEWLVIFVFVGTSAASMGATPSSLSIGLASELRSVDPSRAPTSAEDTMLDHVYETLIRFDPGGVPTQVLAVSWSQQDESSWLFKLRPGVRFHDDTVMTSNDVALSIRRAVRSRPELAAGDTPEWLSVEIVDKSTIRLRTKAAFSMLMRALSEIRIVSTASIRRLDAADGVGLAPAGTGRYRFAEKGAEAPTAVTLVANSKYWGKAPAWKSVTLVGISEERDRLAALTSGTVDMIEQVPAGDLERLRGDARFAVRLAASGRLMYLQLGNHAANPPELIHGGASGRNPLLDPRVRRAMSEALDRRELAAIGVAALGEPAGQLVPTGFFGHVLGLVPDQRNVRDAQLLLAEAGYPDGFTLKVHGPKGVYPGDAEVLTALVRMLGEVNIRAEAVPEPPATFASRGSRQQYSAYLRGFIGRTPDATEALVALLATADPRTGAGSLNWARHSNATFDSLLQHAMNQPRNDARELLLHEATRMAMRELALIPLYFVNNAWASRVGLELAPRSILVPLAERVSVAGGMGAARAPPQRSLATAQPPQ